MADKITVRTNLYLWLLTGRSLGFVNESMNTGVSYRESKETPEIARVRDLLKLRDESTDFYVLAALAAAYTFPAGLRNLPDEASATFASPGGLALPGDSVSHPLLPLGNHGGAPYVDGAEAGQQGFSRVSAEKSGTTAVVRTDAGARVDSSYSLSRHAANDPSDLPGGATFTTTPGSVDTTDGGLWWDIKTNDVPLYVNGGLFVGPDNYLELDLSSVLPISLITDMNLTHYKSSGSDSMSLTVQSASSGYGPQIGLNTGITKFLNITGGHLPADWTGVLKFYRGGSRYIDRVTIEILTMTDVYRLSIPAMQDLGVNGDFGMQVGEWVDGSVVSASVAPQKYPFSAVADRLKKSSDVIRFLSAAGVLDAFAEATDPVRKLGAVAVAVMRESLKSLLADQDGFEVVIDIPTGKGVPTSKTYDLEPAWVSLFGDNPDPLNPGGFDA